MAFPVGKQVVAINGVYYYYYRYLSLVGWNSREEKDREKRKREREKEKKKKRPKKRIYVGRSMAASGIWELVGKAKGRN